MSDMASPPLPAAPGLTLAAADQWRAARVWRRLESRWLALLPGGTFVLAAAADDPLPRSCDVLDACAVSLGETVAVALVLVEALVLLARPRGSALVPAVVGLLLWFLPDALPGTAVRLAVTGAHLAVAAALHRVAAGRRRARTQLAALMGPPVPYPWTLLDQEAPLGPAGRPTARRTLAAVLGLLAVLALGTGLYRMHDSDTRSATADEVRATVRAVHDDGLSATVDYQLPSGGQRFTTTVDIWWDWTPAVGDRIALLADDTGWTRVAGDPYDPTPWWLAAGAGGAAAALLLGSAHRTDRSRRAPADRAPALRVRVRPDGGGHLMVHPVDGGDREPGLWRLPARGTAHFAPEDEDGPAEWLPGPQPGEEPDARTPAEAAHALALADRPVDALLYHGPDAGHRQLLVYAPPEPYAAWHAGLSVDYPATSRLRHRKRRYREEHLAVPALAARMLEQDPETDGPPEPTQVHGMPAALRRPAGPLAALLLGAAVTLLGTDGLLDGLVKPLLLSPLVVAATGAFGWQLAVDRDGIALAGALTVHRIPWQHLTAAAVHRGRFTLQTTDSRQLGFTAWPGQALHSHLGGPYSPAAAARTITLLTHRPERRPRTLLGADAIGGTLLLNRLALVGYLAFVVGRYAFGG